MAPNFDCFSSLICEEDTSIFDEIDDFEDSFEILDESSNSRYTENHNPNHHFGYPNEWLPLQSDECLALMVEKECHHLPQSDYVDRLKSGELDLVGRMKAIDWIEKVREHFGFGPLSTYLSLNYLDRFLSSYTLPKQRDWTIQLLALACLSLATKLEEHKVPPCLDFQVNEPRFVFEAQIVERMELLILSTLKWRMQAVTPFSFIDSFLYKINDEVPKEAMILQSIQLILSTMRGIDFLEFRQSEIAAAVAILVVGETQTVHADNVVYALIQHVEKERVLKCVKMIQELSLGCCGPTKDTTTTPSASASVSCVPQSPIGVLEAICLSSITDDTTNACSCPNTSHDSPDAKRRKENKAFEG